MKEIFVSFFRKKNFFFDRKIFVCFSSFSPKTKMKTNLLVGLASFAASENFLSLWKVPKFLTHQICHFLISLSVRPKRAKTSTTCWVCSLSWGHHFFRRIKKSPLRGVFFASSRLSISLPHCSSPENTGCSRKKNPV